MPKGIYSHKHIKPKQYPSEMVQRVASLYECGASQMEIAEAIGVSQKVVFRLMQNHGIKARMASKRNQSGDQNGSWRGDHAGYAALHKRVEASRGRPMKCDACGIDDPSISYDWASLTGNYADVNDYQRMCRSCHSKYDNRAENLSKQKGDTCP